MNGKDGKSEHFLLNRRRLLGGAALGLGALPLISPSQLFAANAGTIGAAEAMAMAEARRGELVELLSRLIRVQSLSGEAGDVAQGIVTDYLAKLPYDVQASRYRPSDYTGHAEYMPPNPPGDGPFTNVVARPTESGSRHALFAHIDTHRVEDGWTTDPYEPVLRDGRLYGLGTSDDKGGIAAMLIAAAVLSEKPGLAPVLISSHGKGGGSRGSLPVFQAMQDAGESIDALLYVHPAETGRGLADIKHVVRGALDFELSVTGWEGDPLEIGLPDSALWKEGGDALARLSAIIEHLRAGVLAGVDMNVGRLEAGERPGGVPARASARIRLLFDGDYTWRGLMDRVSRELENDAGPEQAGRNAYTVTAEPLGMRSNPGAVPWDARSTRTLRDAITSVTGKAPASYPNHYGGDIRYPLRLLGAPSFGIGSLGGNFYGPNEWVDVDDLVRLVAVLILTLSGWQAVG